MIIGYSGSGKSNALFNLIGRQPDIDKTHVYAKDPFEAKYQLLISKREGISLRENNDSKTFIEYSNDMDDMGAIQIKNANYQQYLMIFLPISSMIKKT